jgi:hypothetical protein
MEGRFMLVPKSLFKWNLFLKQKLVSNLHRHREMDFWQNLLQLKNISIMAYYNTDNKKSMLIMDKLQLTGRNLGRVFNFRSGHLHVAHLWCYQVKLPNLKLKTLPKQLLGSLPLVFVLHVLIDQCFKMEFLINFAK